MVGGALLLLSAIVGLAARGPLVSISPARDWLFAAAGIVFAIGLGRAGSVTGRRLVGTVSTILLVVAPLSQSFWFTLLPADDGDPNAAEDAWVLLATTYYGIIAALAVVSVVAIGLARILPSPWRWAPLWVVIWTPVTFGIGLTIFSSPAPPSLASVGASFSVYAPAAGIAFLGVLGLVLGFRAISHRAATDERAVPSGTDEPVWESRT